MQNGCGANSEMVAKHIEDIADMKSNIKSNQHRLDKVEQTHEMFIRLEAQMKGMDEKIEKQFIQSRENTENIIKALLNNKKNLYDRILDSLVPSIVAVILFSLGYLFITARLDMIM